MQPATRIPIVDLAGVRAGNRDARARAGREIRDACTTIGFFYIVNHGVPQAVIDRAEQAAREFFAFPVETKRRAAVNHRHRGFNALGDATMYQAKRPDYKEFYSIGLELPESDPDVLAGQALRGPNNWPDFMPALQPALYGYYEEVGACGADLLRAVATGLGVPEDFFAPRYTKRMQRTQMVYYPPQPPQSDDEQFGVAPHTDYGCITLLWQDRVGGLQVREIANETWIEAPPIEGSFVVNVGDLLARWTNDRFRSTLHRVINASGRERYSIATFYDPTYTSNVDPRDLGTPDTDSKYEPVAAGDYILGRINSSMGYRKKLAAEQGTT
ncbi:2-oxoglutarate and iron-dependent oxygenase domain-containing protein [Paraburkholderia caribensis]|uniref:2-oxoglutarate-dependent ethylene/succinate-forming enzyme n=1 Tax=Paraburkholderia caribensis TaxID=75105 RepID=A0A9Q6WP99_9BURK|nr:2-oxoglutarate and iron-dependent oxygenase domain-containing protein [Paraburkholderia caribensis]MCO4882940.1 isopenicillin N synthase family oxygenase [Paraburkholderia caribensis]PTB25859.1 oxidoreductase [Paraburkholderia caribensis]QLB65972.1 oxidoreductase [Paraburkholderia caribensis]